MIREYRCTRASLYRPGTIGHADPSARQGYYVWAHNPGAALREMRECCPNDEGAFTAAPTGKEQPLEGESCKRS